MQLGLRAFTSQLLLGSSRHSRQCLPALLKTSTLNPPTLRHFSADLEVKKEEMPEEVDIEAQRKRIGIDMQFSQQKHAYVLTFPWNFPEIISDFEHDYRGVAANSYWHKFVFNNNAKLEFNYLFREFH